MKCVILDNHPQPIGYKLCSQILPHQSSFTYLGVSFKPSGFLDPESLVSRSCTRVLATMNILKSIGLNPSGFSRLLSSRSYAQIVRSQMEYGLAINLLFHSQLKRLEDTLYQGNVTFGKSPHYDRKIKYPTSSIPLSLSIRPE